MNDKPDVFKKIVDLFPYRLNISDTNGFLVYGNDSFFEGTLPKVRSSAIGHYNILHEPLLEKWGLTEHIRRAFRGECVYTPGLRFPNKDLLGSKYGIDHAFFTLYNDVNSFPIFSDDGRLQYIVTAFIPVRQYTASDEVMRAIEYFEKKWTEPLCTRQAAQTAHLSVTSFVQRFKNETGLTPHEYYSQYRMMKLRDILLNSGLAIAQAFDACGMDYNSYYTKLFKRHFGLTPKDFRKQNQ
jgi:AraC-like DNA-binding protein